MLKAPIPANEDARLKDLKSFEILDTEHEKEYDGLVELVSQICGCPYALVNFIDCNRQWFKAYKNMDSNEADREDSFCGHAIMGKDVFIIPDATQDERFYDNPNVTGGLKVRFYAGAPIVSQNGYNLGTVCAFDDKPKSLSYAQVESLKTIADQVSRLLELRQKNKQIIQSARIQVTTQQKVAQMNMAEVDSRHLHTAHVLNEEIIQSIQDVRENIDKARKDPALSRDCLTASVEELDHLTSTIHTLSDTLVPVILTSENYKTEIEKLAEVYEAREGVKVFLNFKGTPVISNQEKGLMLFRIIQDLLSFSRLCGSKSIVLNIQGNHGVDIIFEYDTNKLMPENQRMLLQDNLMTRLEIMKGKYEKKRFDSGETQIHITIPDTGN